MIRLLCLSCCAVFAISLTSFAFREESALAGAPLQPAADNSAGEDFCQCVGETDSESLAKIEQALRLKLTSAGLDFTDAPLEEVASFIQETYQIPVHLDTPALEEIGIGPDEQVTINLHGISLRSALRLLLKSHQLTYVIQNEVLLITTPEEAESKLVACVYDVRDIVDELRQEPPKGRARPHPDFDPLIDAIISCISTDTWADNGGTGDLRPLKSGLLVISQTQVVHEDVRSLLETIRELQRKGAAPGEKDMNGAAADASLDELVTEWNVRK